MTLRRILNWYRNRFIRKAFAQLEAGSGRPRSMHPAAIARRVESARATRAAKAKDDRERKIALAASEWLKGERA